MTASNAELNSGTRPVAESHRFDIAALQSHLERHLPGFAGPLTVEQFKGGQSNPTYKLITPGCLYVMRSKPGPAAKLLASAHAIDREFRVMGALANDGWRRGERGFHGVWSAHAWASRRLSEIRPDSSANSGSKRSSGVRG